jgi:uncharacterized protein DUF87
VSKIVIGHSIVDGKPGSNVKLDVDLLIPSRLLIQANSGGGKSYLLRRLEELLWKIKVQTIVIDPEGEFYTLREKFGYVLVGENGETPADVRSAALLAEKFLQLKASAVCDLYGAFRSKPMQQRQWVRTFLNALLDAPRSLWHPLVVIVDEAHKFCPQETPKAGNRADREIIGGCKDAMIALSTTGRKRGFCPIWATQRLAKLDKDASAEFFNRMVGMTIEDVDVDRAADLMSVSKADKQQFRTSLRNLTPGEFYCFGRAMTTERQLVKVGPVETHHPETGKAAKNAVAPPTPDEVKAFLPQLSDLPKQAEDKARSEADLKRELAELRRKLAAAENKQPAHTVQAIVKADPAQSRALQQLRSVLEEIMRILAKVTMKGFEGDAIKTEEIEAALKKAAIEIGRLASAKITAQQREFDALKKDLDRVMRKAKALIEGDNTVSIGVNITKNEPFTATSAERPFRPLPSPAAAAAAPENGNSLDKGEKAILLAAAQCHPADRVQLSILTGYKRSTRNRYIQFLQQKGYVEDNGEKILPTAEGMAALGTDYEPLPTGLDLQDYWLQRLPEGEKNILAFVLKAGGEAVDREAISGATNYMRSTRNRYIQFLQARHLLKNGLGPVEPAAMLFDDAQRSA